MTIRIDPHTLERAEERGTNEQEIIEVITPWVPIPATRGRQGKANTYPFTANRLGKYYEHKRVEAFFIAEGDVIVTVTVYVFYGEWEIDNGNSV